MKTVREIFADRLNALMQERGHTKRTMSKQTGLSWQTIRDYMNGKKTPRLTEAVMVANALNVSLDYMTGISDNINPIDKRDGNTYWSRVQDIYMEQRKKGIETYGTTLERNKTTFDKRFRYLEEELIDALMYIEWIKDGAHR